MAAFTAAGSYSSAREFIDGFAIGVGGAAHARAAAIAALVVPRRHPVPATICSPTMERQTGSQNWTMTGR